MKTSSYRLGFGRRAANALVSVLLRLGLGPARTYLLTVAGRQSGAPRTTPVTLVEEGGQRWLVAPYGEVAWVREIAADEAAPVLKMYVTRVPITRPYFDAKPESDLAAFRAEAPRHPVFAIVG
jgi:deazaflavin-dependent oxidoreductase (nitroreductase family)